MKTLIKTIKHILIVVVLAIVSQSCATTEHYAGLPEGKYRIAAVGDSITYGRGIENPSIHSYPAQLEVMLGSDWIVGNFGKSGATLLSKGNRPYIKTDLYAEALRFDPDLVVIMLGTNDSKPNMRGSLDNFIPEYLDLIESFQSLESRPLICICYPVPAFDGIWGIDNDVIVKEIVPAIEAVADESGVYLIDLYSPLLSQRDLFPDTVHPDKRGAQLIAGQIYAFIRENLFSVFYENI